MVLDNARNVKAELFEFAVRSSGRPGHGGPRSETLGSATGEDRGPAAEDERQAVPPVAIGIMPSRARDGVKLALIGSEEALLDHPVVERALRISKGDAVFVVAGEPELLSHWTPPRRRPLALGTSISHHGCPAGTLGAFVKLADGSTCILSNNHVLAGVGVGKLGDAIVQPGRNDGGKAEEDLVGSFRVALPINPDAPNQFDCALAELAEGLAPTVDFVSNEAGEVRRLLGLAPAGQLFAEDLVEKIGRTSGHTVGQVFAVEVDNYRVNLGSATRPIRVRFDNQIQVWSKDRPFALPGDSGALLIDRDGQAHGLVFAGTARGGPSGTGLAAANVLELALQELGATLWLR